MALEVRYVGTRGHDSWRTHVDGNNGGGNGNGTLNYNEFNIFENGFIDEFRLAQAQPARRTSRAGRGTTFAYTGAPGTAPLPTFLAFFNAQSAGECRQRRALHRHELDERDVPRTSWRRAIRIRSASRRPAPTA